MTPAELKLRRAALGMSQSQLATALGITEKRYQVWEVGRNAIPPFLHLALDALAARQPRIDETLTTEEAAALLGRSPQAVRHAVRAGRLTARLVTESGKRPYYLISRTAVEFYNQYQKRRPGDHAAGPRPRREKPVKPPGVRRGKLTEADARAILSAKGNQPAAQLATEYGISRATIYAIWNGQTWSHLQPKAAEEK